MCGASTMNAKNTAAPWTMSPSRVGLPNSCVGSIIDETLYDTLDEKMTKSADAKMESLWMVFIHYPKIFFYRCEKYRKIIFIRVSYIYSMADDSFATPVNSLSASVNTREGDGPKNLNDIASYADLLRAHDANGPPQDPSFSPMMAPPPQQQPSPGFAPPSEAGFAPHQGGFVQGPPHQQGFAPPPPPPNYAYDPYQQAPPPPEKQAWWKVWVYNKQFWITLSIIFFMLYIVYPKVATMPRFAMAPLPTYVLGLMALVGAIASVASNMVI